MYEGAAIQYDFSIRNLVSRSGRAHTLLCGL